MEQKLRETWNYQLHTFSFQLPKSTTLNEVLNNNLSQKVLSTRVVVITLATTTTISVSLEGDYRLAADVPLVMLVII